jgi:hypothetical protein
MGTYNYLPGLQIQTLDGGLATKATPTAQSTVIVGTSGIGPADTVYQVTSPSAAAADFGFAGSLIQGMQEVAQGGCDNLFMFRMGTPPAVLSGVGAVTSGGEPVSGLDVGFTLTFNTVEADAVTRYQVNYDGAGTLIVFLDGNICWSNVTDNAVDTGDVDVEGTARAGLAVQSTSILTDAFSKSLSLTAAALLTSVTTGASGAPGASGASGASGAGSSGAGASGAGSTTNAAPALAVPVTGLNLTKRQIYVALIKAFQLLEIFPMQQVFCPDAVAMNPAIQFKASGSDVGVNSNDPATNPNALDWLNTAVDDEGDLTFHWATESEDSNGATCAPVTFTSVTNTEGTGRLDLDYHEVCFEYAVARFCAKQSQNAGGCQGFIGFPQTSSYGPVGLRNWIGFRQPCPRPLRRFPRVRQTPGLRLPGRLAQHQLRLRRSSRASAMWRVPFLVSAQTPAPQYSLQTQNQRPEPRLSCQGPGRLKRPLQLPTAPPSNTNSQRISALPADRPRFAESLAPPESRLTNGNESHTVSRAL